MANRTLYPAQNYGSSRVYAEIRFTAPGAGTSVPASSVDGANIVASIAHVAGTNKLTITLKDTFRRAIYANANVLEGAVGDGQWASVGNVANEGTATPIAFDVYTWSAAGAAANDSARTIVVALAFKNGSWGVQ